MKVARLNYSTVTKAAEQKGKEGGEKHQENEWGMNEREWKPTGTGEKETGEKT